MSEEKTVKSQGRPVDPTSKRQQKLINMEAKKSDPNYKLGRPINMDSKRQQKITARLSGVKVAKGRPKMTEEEKALAKAERLSRTGSITTATIVGDGSSIPTPHAASVEA